MKTAEDFENAAIKHEHLTWFISKCSICNVPIGYIIYPYDAQPVRFDGSCDCSSLWGEQPSSYDKIADHYNLQTSPDVIQEYNKFWGFQE